MQIHITNKQARVIGKEHFEPWGFNENSWGWRENDYVSITLRIPELTQAKKLASLLRPHVSRELRGLGLQVKNIDRWLEAADAASPSKLSKKVPTIRAFETMLTEYMRQVPGHRVYRQESKHWFSYLVDDITFIPKRIVRSRGEASYTIEAHVDVTFICNDVTGVSSNQSATFWDGCEEDKTVPEILMAAGWYVETDELRQNYTRITKRYQKLFARIGKQFLYTGSARTKAASDGDYWWTRSYIEVSATNAKVVVDLLVEEEGSVKKKRRHWSNEEESSGVSAYEASTWKITVEDDDGSKKEVSEPLEVPVHPYLYVFHLEKHFRIRVHSEDLTKYKYDTKLFDKLVIDEQRKRLVKLLINHRNSGYQDIVSGKAGGAIIILCGPPGVGKTLTAEVFAESERRPLYSVQCSQLGLTPEALEQELLKVLARAARWKAVLLLDEADVYIHKRGSDVTQNAMVGVFLRVLEYQNAIMFMTTNRAKDIDDAVASRATARLEYQAPSPAELRKIWRVLADSAGVTMDDTVIKAVVAKHSDLSGRDVKQLIKLAMLVNEDKVITADAVDFVKQFKPT